MPVEENQNSESIIPRKTGLPPGEGAEKGLITLPGESERELEDLGGATYLTTKLDEVVNWARGKMVGTRTSSRQRSTYATTCLQVLGCNCPGVTPILQHSCTPTSDSGSRKPASSACMLIGKNGAKSSIIRAPASGRAKTVPQGKGNRLQTYSRSPIWSVEACPVGRGSPSGTGARPGMGTSQRYGLLGLLRTATMKRQKLIQKKRKIRHQWRPNS